MSEHANEITPWWASETAILLSEVPQALPRNGSGRKVHVASVYRWASTGLRGARLRWFRVGGRRATTREELNRFFAQLTDRWDGGDHEPGQDRLRARGLV